MIQTESGYDIVLSLLHEYTKTTTNPQIDAFTLWLLRRKIYDLQQQKEIIRHKILQDSEEFQKQKEVKQ